ncbi:MAG: dihydroorotase [Candidatus Aminicenantes bacterium]|nr:dihydroorotase [Candidatus Aminicenantes bacterium]
MNLLIKNGRVIDPISRTDETLDILIENGQIKAISPRLEANEAEIIDASRLVVAPGFIDMHVHLREPGQEHKEDLITGSRAAARGGFTSICCMPNTKPPNDNSGITEYLVVEAKKKAVVNIFPIAAITRELAGEELTDMVDLSQAGAVAFSDDGHPITNSLIMRRALEYSLLLNKLIIDHCEDKNLSAGGVMHEGEISCRLGLPGMPAAAEEIMIARDLILAELTRARIHIAHISTRGGIEFVRLAKKKGLAVSAEVTPHHLILTDECLANYDPNFKVNPPLRSADHRQALIDGLKDGTIDVIATDHAPHTPEEKDVEFDQAPFGLIGLETAVSLMLDRFVHKNIISLERLIQLMASNPAQLLGLKNKGRIAVGADADLTLLNLRKEVIIDVNRFASKSRNSPFHGWKLRGAVAMTIVGGKIVYSS